MNDELNNQSNVNQSINNSNVQNMNNISGYNNNYNFNNSSGQLNNNINYNSNGQQYNQFVGNLQPINKSKKKKSVLFIILGIVLTIIISLLVVFLILSKDKSKSRTIMIYMVGSDLESNNGLATVDLESINYNTMDSENVNVVLIAGGTKEWNNSYIDVTETSIYELTSSGYEKVKSQNIQNMGDYKVFSNYLNYVYENYKTDEYDLVFWNHGGAIYGSEFDDISEDNLSLTEMKQGLSNSHFNNKNKLETVIFRTCLNGTIEIADVFKDYSDYLVASEEVTLGARYTSVLNFVNNIDSSDTGADVGIKFVDSYKNQIAEMKKRNKTDYVYSTYSVVDLSKVKNLVESLNQFVSDINISESYNEIAKVRSNLYQYAYTNSTDPAYDMVDLYNLVYELKDLSIDKANNVLENLESAVIYNWATNNKSRGISIYFPYNGSVEAKKLFLNVYNQLDSFTTYNKFITNFNLKQSSSTESYSFSSNKTTVKTNNEESDFSLELTDDQKAGYAKAEYLVFMDKGNGYYWPVYKGKEVTLDGNILKANINGKHLKIKADNQDYVFPLFETYNEEDYIKYTTSVILQDFSDEDISNWKTDSAELSLVLNKKTKKIQVSSVILNEEDDNKPNSVAVNLEDYQYISFGSMSHKLLDENGNFDVDVYKNNNNGIFEGIEITPDELSNLSLSSFDDENDYYCVFRIYDVNNNNYYSKLVKMN